MRRRAFASLLVAIAILGIGSVAAAQDSATARSASDSALEARTSAVAARLRCPVCQGESIQDSPSELAQQMRAVVRDQLRAGRTPEEIEAYFVSKYGEWILLEPTMTGFNVLLYAFPVLLVAGGLALIVVLVRRWSAAPAPEAPSVPPPHSEP